MITDFRQLMSKPVVRLEDVAALRAQIESRYPEEDAHHRAELLADGINRMLDAGLTGLDASIKDTIKRRLIAEQLIGSRQSILKLDVLNRILAQELPPDQLVTKTWGWYVLNTGHSLTLSDFMDQASPYLPHRVREAVKAAEDRMTAYQAAARRNVADFQADASHMESEPVSEAIQHAPFQRVNDLVQHFLERLKQLTAYRLTPKGRWTAVALGLCLTAAVLAPLLASQINVSTPTAGGKTSDIFIPPKEYRPVTASAGPALQRLEKPHYLRYQNISLEKLKDYLGSKHSMLLTSDYLDQLMAYSCEKDLNPLLLIAIIGQEQNYVPTQHRYAQRIIENPFNIYGSWETHPVGFTASMKEACYTINTALSQRTLYSDPFAVINSRYAQDPRWHIGVKVIFRDLMALAGE